MTKRNKEREGRGRKRREREGMGRERERERERRGKRDTLTKWLLDWNKISSQNKKLIAKLSYLNRQTHTHTHTHTCTHAHTTHTTHCYQEYIIVEYYVLLLL